MYYINTTYINFTDSILRFSNVFTDFMAICSTNFWEMGFEIFSYYCENSLFFLLVLLVLPQSLTKRTQSQVLIFQSSSANVLWKPTYTEVFSNTISVKTTSYSDIMHFQDRDWYISKMPRETPILFSNWHTIYNFFKKHDSLVDVKAEMELNVTHSVFVQPFDSLRFLSISTPDLHIKRLIF